jgi:hypothetical protein
MKIVTSVYSDQAWTLPVEEVGRLQRLFPHLSVVNAPSRDDRLRELRDADVAFLSQLKPDEFEAAACLRWIQSPRRGWQACCFPNWSRARSC